MSVYLVLSHRFVSDRRAEGLTYGHTYEITFNRVLEHGDMDAIERGLNGPRDVDLQDLLHEREILLRRVTELRGEVAALSDDWRKRELVQELRQVRRVIADIDAGADPPPIPEPGEAPTPRQRYKMAALSTVSPHSTISQSVVWAARLADALLEEDRHRESKA